MQRNSVNSAPSQRVLAALVLVQVLFGTNYLFSKIILEKLPPLVWASLRAGSTAAILVITAICLRKLQLRKAVFYYRQFILFSLLGIAINQGCFLMGLKYTSPTNSALINTLIPVFTILLVAIRGQETISPLRAIGFCCAFVGVLIVHKPENFRFSDQTFLGDLLTLVNTFSYSLFLAFCHRFLEKMDFVWATTWLFVYGSLGLFMFSIPEWNMFSWPTLTPQIWTTMVISVLFGSILPYLLISFTLGRASSSTVALFVYIQPIVASIMSFFFLNEQITARTVLSGLFIFVGVFLAITQKRIVLTAVPAEPEVKDSRIRKTGTHS